MFIILNLKIWIFTHDIISINWITRKKIGRIQIKQKDSLLLICFLAKGGILQRKSWKNYVRKKNILCRYDNWHIALNYDKEQYKLTREGRGYLPPIILKMMTKKNFLMTGGPPLPFFLKKNDDVIFEWRLSFF